ncbi:MAG: hypothetical protein V3T49_06955, partial [Dehalococcoidia bacterium]
ARAEDLVLEAVEGGMNAVIVRPATVFGRESGRGGLIVNRLLAGGLKVLPAPSRMISPVWSGDLATALIRAAESGAVGQTYTVAGPTITPREFVDLVCEGAGVQAPRISIPAWAIAVPLQLAWWASKLTPWKPPVSVQAVRKGSTHDGSAAARELGFEYTPIPEVFSNTG